MIELFSANTPNGWKISIMLEEIGYEYKVTKVDIGKDEQFKQDSYGHVPKDYYKINRLGTGNMK